MIRNFVIWYGIMSVYTFVIYAIDKRRSMKNARRVSEKALLISEFFGGWIGGIWARHFLRHKTKKQPFLLYAVLIDIFHTIILISVIISSI